MRKASDAALEAPPIPAPHHPTYSIEDAIKLALEEDVADLVAISDVNVAAASEALGSGLGVALARLAGNAAELAASPAAMLATAAMARGAYINKRGRFALPPDPELRPDWREVWLQRLEELVKAHPWLVDLA